MIENVPDVIQTCLEQLAEHYSNFQMVDRGGSGFLWFAQNRISHAEVAIKFYAGEPGDRRHDEPKLLSQISSPNILPIHDARNVSEDWAYFVTPRCDGGDLDDAIKSRPSVHDAVDIILGIGQGVSEIHARKMVHRDLKPGNIVIDGTIPRIADFGTVRIIDETVGGTIASQHSCLYRPPESWATNLYTRAGDVYQVGLVAYQLFGGVLHYDGREYLSQAQRKTYESIEDNIDRSLFVDAAIRSKSENCTLADLSSLPPWITTAAKRALRLLLHPDPTQRTGSMADLTAAMHQLRGSIPDWSFKGSIARLCTSIKVVELRPTDSGGYEAFQQKKGKFRRVPGMQSGTLAALVKNYSG